MPFRQHGRRCRAGPGPAARRATEAEHPGRRLGHSRARPTFGPYGNRTVQTPSLDHFATQAALFERNHPECLPTIPTRRTLHSGRRAYPFRNYTPVPWDNVYLPGWQPMDPEQETVAEALARAGYHCGFVADVPHYFVPGMNFTRGFHQWDFVRGASEDRYRSTAPYDPKELARRYAPGRGAPHTANLGGFEPDEMDFATPRTFTSAMRFLDENRTLDQPFYLYVDTFHPHETWEAPRNYYDLYRDPAYKGKTHLNIPYSTLYQNPLPDADLADIRAQYSGLVTMVDHWFGQLLAKLEETGKSDSTYVFFVSDHGTNFGDNLEKVTGKPAGALYPGTMHIPLLIRHPKGAGAGKRFNQFTYTLDVPATVCAAAGASPEQGVDGKNLLDLLEGRPLSAREYVTCRYSNTVWYRDDANWYFSDVYWNNPRLFDMEASEPFSKTIARQAAERVALARKRILEDAGGTLPKYPMRGTDTVKAPFI
ncbi:MAG: sulfatase [Bryobacterales bacterium]